jgi:hypothetical protein
MPKNWGCYGKALLLGPLRLGKNSSPESAVPQQARRLASLRRGLRAKTGGNGFAFAPFRSAELRFG